MKTVHVALCKLWRCASVLLLLLLSLSVEASQLKTFSSGDGLSNNAVLSIYQNDIGHLYIGTADGLNVWDGHSMRTFVASDRCNYFFGNMIWHIFPYQNHTIVLHTNHGVALLDTRTNDVEFFDELPFLSKIAVANDGNLVTLHRDNTLCLFDMETRKICKVADNFLGDGEVCRRMTMLDDGRLCVFTDRDIYLISLACGSEQAFFISEITNLNIACRYVSPIYEDECGGGYQLLVSENRIYRFDSVDCTIREVTVCSNMPEGDISGIVPLKEGWYVSFPSSGIWLLQNGQDALVRTEIDLGVFSMIYDRNQPIIWIGTDCNGLIRYNLGPRTVSCLTYDAFPHPMKMPVRSVHVDKERTLWFGTKGDGLFRIPDLGDGGGIDPDRCRKSDTQNSLLNHNAVYVIEEGDSGVLWIGTEGRGLNCWTYASRSIGRVRGSETMRMIHSVIEQNDSTLWVGTDGNGVYRCRFVLKNGVPVITESIPIRFCEPFDESTSVFAMEMQNDSIIWVGSRGQGVLAYNVNTGKSRVMKLPVDNGFAINETFFIARSDRMLFATGNGLASYCPEGNSVSVSDAVPRKATHGIVCDGDKNIWVSTNSGIISLDSLYNYRFSFDRFSGIEVIEYSDGACCFDQASGKVIFGGINGLTIIDSDEIELSSSAAYTPEINVTDFIQNDKRCHIGLMMKRGKLVLPYSKSMFGIAFSVVDHLNYSNYEFIYNIEGYSSDWLSNDKSNVIYMPSLDSGRYKLKIVYLNKALHYRSDECVLPIYIRPPFYRTWCAYILYTLAVAFVILLLVRNYRRKYLEAQEQIKKKYSEKIAVIAKDTTNAINESLSVQLTFIMGLCQQIRLTTQNNPNVADKVKLVEYNAAKISKTLHAFNEYKSITESMISAGKISFISVNDTLAEVLEIIQADTAGRNVCVTSNIEEDITLALNKEAFLTMLYALMYKVISSARGEKTVSLHMKRDDSGNLMMTTALSSDRKTYEEMNRGDDMVFCRQLVMMMTGKMNIAFAEGSGIITIEISLPSQKPMQGGSAPDTDSSLQEGINSYNTIIENILPRNFRRESALNHIYVISDKRETSSFLGYFLSDDYNVSSYAGNDVALESVGKQIPDAVIYDVSSKPNGFVDFIEAIKGNRRMEQAIIVALTSSLQTSERELYVQLGADLCISFPFNMNYLRAALEKMLQKKKNTAEYYGSPMSKFVVSEGKIIHQEDKEFFDKVLQIIERNISNPDLTAKVIADALGTSTRVMYRRLESITDRKLHQMIRDARIDIAVSLLSSSKHTIDEIMYKVGYDSRSTFYRSFKAICGKTPKEYREDIHNNVVANITKIKR